MKTLNLNIISIKKEITQEEETCDFWDRQIAYEGGLYLFSSHTDNDYLSHTSCEYFTTKELLTSKDVYNSAEFEYGRYGTFDIICELITDKGNLVTVFRAENDLFSCYHIGDKKIIKNDAIWALSNLDLK